ncbi:hypothetical protein [Rhodomicrobium sp. R_RK_3]|nr:hypothetical protein [Rhodomicrobium sp. R_RK_3]
MSQHATLPEDIAWTFISTAAHAVDGPLEEAYAWARRAARARRA